MVRAGSEELPLAEDGLLDAVHVLGRHPVDEVPARLGGAQLECHCGQDIQPLIHVDKFPDLKKRCKRFFLYRINACEVKNYWFLNGISLWGKGRYYFSGDMRNILKQKFFSHSEAEYS
jgi:hypothetical protein